MTSISLVLLVRLPRLGLRELQQASTVQRVQVSINVLDTILARGLDLTPYYMRCRWDASEELNLDRKIGLYLSITYPCSRQRCSVDSLRGLRRLHFTVTMR
jgi:hypothetical protein